MKVLNYKSFLENSNSQFETEEFEGDGELAEGEPDFTKISVPGTSYNLYEFEKKIGRKIRSYELSKDKSEVTEIDGKSPAQIMTDEFERGGEY